MTKSSLLTTLPFPLARRGGLSSAAFLVIAACSNTGLAAGPGATAEAATQPAPASATDKSPVAEPDDEATGNDAEGDEPADEAGDEAAPQKDTSAPSDEEGNPGENAEPAEVEEPQADEPEPEPEPEPEAPYDGPATLLGSPNAKMHVGGYGGLSIQGTTINKSAGVLLGGEGALLLAHQFAIGIAGYGLASEVRGPDFSNGDDSLLGFGYGGLSLRYHFMSKQSPVTVSVGSLIGAGGLTLLRRVDAYDIEVDDTIEANAFFVAEPTLQVHLHLTRWMRVGVGGGYRFVRGPSLGVIEDGDLEGVTFGGHLQFGWF